MTNIAYIHWNHDENDERATVLREAGYTVHAVWHQDSGKIREIKKRPLDCIVIDLRRIPSQGRAFGILFRQQQSTRHIPIVFIRGDKDKTRRVEGLLPDAIFTEWQDILNTIPDALKQKQIDPIVPGTMDSYAGTPLPKKLGLRSDSTVLLIGAPTDMEEYIRPIPDTVSVTRDEHIPGDIVLLFAKSRAELDHTFPSASECLMDGGKLWIIWPKKASGFRSDLTQQSVRSFGLEREFVDYKIASIDETWSGLCFARRRETSEIEPS